MGDRSAIEWCDATWNPIRGCSRVSEGCRHCYAERTAIRHAYSKGDVSPDGGVAQHDGAYRGLVESTKAGPRWTGVVRAMFRADARAYGTYAARVESWYYAETKDRYRAMARAAIRVIRGR